MAGCKEEDINLALDQKLQVPIREEQDGIKDAAQINDNESQDHKKSEQTHATPSANDIGVSLVQKKKKKKSKSKSQRGLTAPTGFEEYYVDAPLTLAEHELEKGIYDPSNPFNERIECAIQRYAAKRNMDSARKNVFDKYLAYGGIECGPKQFSGGLNAADNSDMTATDIALMKAIHFVAIDKDGNDGANYVVDFEACAKAFLSVRLPQVFDLSSENTEQDVKSKTTIIRNFLNYLLHHDVCPEYADQIRAAQRVCDLADKELPMAMRSRFRLPGDFNTACSELFGGSLQGLHAANPEWAPEKGSVEVGIDLEKAKQTFKIALAVHGSDELSQRYRERNAADGVKIVSEYDADLEIAAIEPADERIRHFYRHHPAAKGLDPVGKLIAKSWLQKYPIPRDVTHEEALLARNSERVVEKYEFWVDDYVLDKCFVGMKFRTTIRELSFGLKFFDSIFGVWCSFFTLLPNEAIIGWRQVEDEPLPMREKVDTSLNDMAGNEDGEGE
ncbi:MAG: hypothetical protein Q9167_004505 [Letrouitia subvulpina]